MEEGTNRWTRIIRVEPDFVMSGDITLTLLKKEFPQGEETESTPYVFNASTERIDMREQARLFRLRFESSESGGFFEMGRVMIHTEEGDVRS